MSRKVRLTKNELRYQRDALERYRRYLPTLSLKKRQLQAEVRFVQDQLSRKRTECEGVRGSVASWIALFSEPFDMMPYLEIVESVIGTENIAGVEVPVLRKIEFTDALPDPFDSPVWTDTGIEVARSLIRLETEIGFYEKKLSLLGDELRTTSQRVNLFEKVKIPECKENIRKIQVFLGDQQSAAVSRAKIAKSKLSEKAVAS